MLAESVRTQRENAIVTVEQVVAGSEKTVMVYRHVEPAVDYEHYSPPSEYEDDHPALILLDGSRLEVHIGCHLPSCASRIIGRFWGIRPFFVSGFYFSLRLSER